MAPRVLVAGGGIGGLATALACSRAGCAVTVFEKTPAFEPIGAGIQLGPNVTRILHSWGLTDALTAVAVAPKHLQVHDAASGRQLGQLRLGQAAVQRYGAPYLTLHRADLHALLLAALAQASTSTVRTGTAIASFKQEVGGVSVKLAGGETIEGDVLVGADGLWSPVRQQLLDDGPPPRTGHVALRALVPQQTLPPALRSQNISVWLGPRMHAVYYPVRGGDWLNLVVILEAPIRDSSDGWNQAFDAELLRKLVPSLCAPLQNTLQAAEAWQAWPLCRRAPMKSAREQAQGRVALLGDAAHPMLPYMAQGAGMAIEDAACLGDQLARWPQDMTQAISQFAAARWQRNARVQKRSLRNGRIFHADGVLRLARNSAMQLAGERLLDVPWLYQA
jgi:salicylate hydroxylase